MARWQSALLIRIARAGKSILINTTGTCRKLINKKKRPDGRGRHTCWPGSKQDGQQEDPSKVHLHITWHLWAKQEDSRKIPPFCSKVYLYINGICEANKETRDQEVPFGSILLQSASVFGIYWCLANKKTGIIPRNPLYSSGLLLVFCII